MDRHECFNPLKHGVFFKSHKQKSSSYTIPRKHAAPPLQIHRLIRLEEFKYLGTTLTNKNYIQEKIKSRLKLGNACYYSVQNLLSSSLLSKKLKIKIYRTIILPVVLYGCETWSLTLREELRLRVFENRALRRVFGPKRDEVTGDGENCIMRSLVICTPYRM